VGRERMLVSRRTRLTAITWRMAFFLGLALLVKLHPPVWLLPMVVLAVGLARIVTFIAGNQK
jgi:hypothetical protein